MRENNFRQLAFVVIFSHHIISSPPGTSRPQYCCRWSATALYRGRACQDDTLSIQALPRWKMVGPSNGNRSLRICGFWWA